MNSTSVGRVSRWAITILALCVALALVLGVRPRALAQEVGVAPIETGVCFLCDGSTTAAAMAPAADSLVPAALLTILVAALLFLPPAVQPSRHLGREAAAPPAPPPRA